VKKKTVVARVTVNLKLCEMDALCQALKVRYDVPTDKERGRFLRHAILSYSSAVARLGERYHPGLLACDLRKETPQEYHRRTGEPLEQQQLDLPDNIVSLFG
jgi:hypothetical protein